MNNGCCNINTTDWSATLTGCNPAPPPNIKSIALRKKKNGRVQIKINGEGKWINAEYDEQSQTIKYNVK